MKVKKKWSCLGVKKVTTKFMLVIFTAIVIYVCLNLVFSSSTLSLKVDMFIKMQRVKLKVGDKGINSSYLHNYYNTSNTSTHGIKSENKQRMMKEIISKNRTIIHHRVGNVSSFSESFVKIPKTDSGINHGEHSDMLHADLGSRDKVLTDGKTADVISDNHLAHISDEKQNISNNSNGEISKNKTTDIIDIFGNIEHGSDSRRKFECDKCFQHNFNYVIENDICKVQNSEQPLDLVVLVTTSHKNTKARAALRATWLSHTRKNTHNIRYAFLLGEHVETRYNELILKENNVYHDIIQEEFIDSYKNLTYKTIMGLKWVSTKCSHARFVMKTDDDMFVNLPNVIRVISGPIGDILQSAVAGSCTQKAKPIRHKQSKWYASIESYPQQVYPGFCSGTGYIMSMNVASAVYDISPNVPFFHLEDVYVALCLRKLGFKLQRIPGFNVSRRRMDPCLFKGRFLITVHHMSPIMLQMVWNRKCTRMHV